MPRTWLQKFDWVVTTIMSCAAMLLVGFLLVRCAAVKPVLRTVDDAASILCELFATEHKAELKLTPQEFCDVKENFQPFIDQVLAAQRAAGDQVGTRLGLEPDGAP